MDVRMGHPLLWVLGLLLLNTLLGLAEVKNRAVVTLQPSWPVMYGGEMITLRCEIKDGGDTEWEYEWNTTSSDKPKEQNEYRISSAFPSHSGAYRCRGRRKNTKHSSTDWSEPITLTVSDKPQPVLTVFPSWLSPGGSVTLTCEVEHPSAGWRFYWYKAVPKQAGVSYSYVLLPGSLSGTEQDSYVVHGQTRTAGYVCTTKRGEQWHFARYSEPKFVWSADFPSSASVSVSPNRVQHFTYKSVSLSCERNSSEWRMKTFSKDSQQKSLPCSYWGTVTGSTCNLHSYGQRTAVYWCESGSGEFSSAVNVTLHNRNIILASPVHPVPEGGSVSLSCKLREEVFVSNVLFYRNNELIQNDTRTSLNISAVSKSHEGFYSCQHSHQVSAQSWMSVTPMSRPERYSSPVLLIVGLVFGLLVLLLLFYRYRSSKDSCFTRPVQFESLNLGSALHPVVNDNEAQREYSTLLHVDADLYESINGTGDTENDSGIIRSVQSESSRLGSATNPGANHNEAQSREYTTLLHGDTCLYESLRGSEDTENDAGEYQNLTYSLTELEDTGENGK